MRKGYPLLLLSLLFLIILPASRRVHLNNIRFYAYPDYTRVVLDLSSSLKIKEKDPNKKLAYEKKIDSLKKEYYDYYRVNNYRIQNKIKNIQTTLLSEIYKNVKKIAENEGYTHILDIESKTDQH